MCGIVGYVGGRQAYPILVKGLTRLEYRGYDSAGVALVNDNGDLVVYKTKGKVKDLERAAEGKDVSGTVGIAHTRWATHGEPSDVNSHPHYSENHELALIHNGIIENYQALKTELTRKGYHFRSQTDTEVVIQLIQYMMDSMGVSFDEAVPLALNHVVGAYALVIMDKREPDKIGPRGGRKPGRVIEREAVYIADFVYKDAEGREVVEDCKGMRTRDYLLKRKLMFFRFGIRIMES